MFFFQDDIGLLIQLSKLNFWQFLITPQAEHFAPILHLLSFMEYKLFGLNFYGYFSLSLILHFLNLFILFKTLRLINIERRWSILFSSLFLINLTFVEPLLWFSAQGVILANLFIGLAFYFWLQRSFFSYIFLVFASFSYSTGLGLGIIFGIISVVYGKLIPAYFILGILSLIVGPLVAGSRLGQVTPQITDLLLNILQFLAFVIGGVGRGVFGRLFIPGFEPRHFEIAKTLISFIPFALISALVTKFILTGPKKFSQILLSLSVMIVYPYIWAGLIRYQFGIKQALSERYAYPSLFFTVILLAVLSKYFLAKKKFISFKSAVLLIAVLLFFQTYNFYRKAVEFEVRPLQTKQFINSLQEKLEAGQAVPDLPLPVFINQPFTISDILPLISPP
ncbi:hypothetical protein A2W14_03365 [Candidatus Gottesmanbacteria bacterium RBG_16_37_8]|uniref:Glycosyltransferase RgtA/B/C/D-like domain-containing protein n=1 Tax=Candidatus Gottesmanbacteria bacterium RBG_16_37_8 TaxID=1798371 RepID=A0A1F5YTU3_9BACT|nr:MAG: hypothetical protein A2W14_03365 [Candidatus Gottesmanbacteria bacterium RBG_16_37_8]